MIWEFRRRNHLIEDVGPGVPPALKERIFQDFFTERTALATLPEGTGLGLAIARRVVSAHRGQIAEIGNLGEGAHFLLWFPEGHDYAT